MKGKVFIKIGAFLMAIGFAITSYETVNGLVKEYLDDVNLSKEIVSSINVKYDMFLDDVDRYKTNLEDLYASYDIYLDDFIISNYNIRNNITFINVDLLELLSTAEELNEYCSYDINGTLKNEKCDIFKKNYKSSIDSYHKAIDEYNRIVGLYNNKSNKKVDYYVSPIDTELNNLYNEL